MFRKGDVYEVMRPFEALVLTTWFAPFTGGDKRTLPVGLRFCLSIDPPSGATAVSADVEHAKRWEQKLVSIEERTADKYSGYYLVIPFDQVGNNCTKCPSSTARLP
jgi:hypothetical protein